MFGQHISFGLLIVSKSEFAFSHDCLDFRFEEDINNVCRFVAAGRTLRLRHTLIFALEDEMLFDERSHIAVALRFAAFKNEGQSGREIF